MTPKTMTPDGLISVQAMTARIACRWMSTRQLEAMSGSIDHAARLSARSQWEYKAAAHAEIFSLLGDATGYPALARLADLATRVGPRRDADGGPGSGRHDPQLAPPTA
jgi:hypothetical protein